jgi:hypothetical protein
MAEEHKRGAKKGAFCACAVSGGKCDCGHNYRSTNKPKFWPFQAHHLLPVTCVNSVLVSDSKIIGILRQTKWCINAKDNMFGMPTWGFTVQYYCKFTRVLRSLRIREPAPKWKNIPQHLNDHNIYNEEVSSNLTSVVEGWKVTGHQIQATDIAGDLETLSDTMKGFLKDRGIRVGGTHAAWKGAIKGEEPDWYKPFSMAEEPCPRAFPIRDDSSSESSWIDLIAKALTK